MTRALRKHIEEMGNDPDKDRPFFFSKPCDATVDVSRGGSKIPYPQETSDLQHEVELVVTIGKSEITVYRRFCSCYVLL